MRRHKLSPGRNQLHWKKQPSQVIGDVINDADTDALYSVNCADSFLILQDTSGNVRSSWQNQTLTLCSVKTSIISVDYIFHKCILILVILAVIFFSHPLTHQRSLRRYHTTTSKECKYITLSIQQRKTMVEHCIYQVLSSYISLFHTFVVCI